MAKIMREITYKGKICKFEKKIGKLFVYSYYENEKDDCPQLILVDGDCVLIRIGAVLEDGAYGLGFSHYDINVE